MGDALLAGRHRLLLPVDDTATSGLVWLARDEVLGREVALKRTAVPVCASNAEWALLHERTLVEVRGLGRAGPSGRHEDVGRPSTSRMRRAWRRSLNGWVASTMSCRQRRPALADV
ncbi:hypothetical protein [Micromonospora sp. NPDC005979]|uniref:hypothetical protein n=1 Tax=Micromonospora sp. NPDC005979 TaxID=3156726 RepID=UPI0033B6500C